MEINLENKTEERIKIITGKDLKKTLLGKWARRKEIPKTEAAFLLVKAELVENSLQAKETLDFLIGKNVPYNFFNNLAIYNSGENYKIELY